MACVAIKGVKNDILKGIDLTVQDGEFLVIVGPSGAGKSTLLHTIAGFVPYEGSILFDNHPVDSFEPHEREIGVVFQDLLLFPHLSVQANLALGMNRLALKRNVVKERSRHLLDRFGLRDLARRRPDELSGGEKQRVALARALGGSPRVLLLDEPLSHLDLQTAHRLRRELLGFQKALKITAILVTHNMEDATVLGDRVGILRNGSLVMECTPHEFAVGNMM